MHMRKRLSLVSHIHKEFHCPPQWQSPIWKNNVSDDASARLAHWFGLGDEPTPSMQHTIRGRFVTRYGGRPEDICDKIMTGKKNQ